MHDINKLLDQIQTENNLSNYGLAKLLNVSPQYIHQFKRKPFLLNETVCMRIAKHAEADPIEIIASVNYLYGQDHERDFWKSVYFGQRIKNYKVEYGTGGFYVRAWWMRKR